MKRLWLCCALALSARASAYEADQLTGRGDPPADAAPAANAEMDRILDAAIAETNRETRCNADDRRTRFRLAKALRKRVARSTIILSRGFWRGFAHNPYEELLETSPAIPRRAFPEDQPNIYQAVEREDSRVLSHSAVASTIRLGDHLVGTDKIAHFQVEGYDMWRKSREGADVPAAVAWATGTENGSLGLGVSQVFSFADLAADWAGLQFHLGLLGPDSVAQRGPDGCVTRTRPWDWTAIVTDDWDEVASPSVYAPAVAAAILRHLDAHRDEICADYARWGTDAYRDGLARRLAQRPEYASILAPERTDPFRLDALCGGP
jgi:hypothetical protein